MDIPVPKFQAKTETEIKNYNVIKTVLSKLYDAENDLFKKRNDAFDEINNIIEENPDLKTIYLNFSNQMKELEKSKNEHVLKIKTKLIPTTEDYINQAKKTKQEIGNYKNIKNKTQDQEEEMKKMRSKGQDVKNSQISMNISQNKSTMQDLGKNIEDRIMKYECDRATNNKLIMLHLINYEMAYHANSIEKLTDLFKLIKETNPKKSINQSMRSLGVSQQVDEGDESEKSEENNEEEEEDEDQSIKKSTLAKSNNKSLRKSKKEESEDEIDDEK